MSQQSSHAQAPPTWTHHPTLQDLVSLKSAIFLFNRSEDSQPIKTEALSFSSDWLTDLLLLELQREA